MVRAGDNNELIPLWLSKGIVSIGWDELGNPAKSHSREKLIQKANEVYSDEKPGTRIQWASQTWRFSHEIELSDRIITYEKDSREYLTGIVISGHEFQPSPDNHYPNIIGVKWEKKRIPRDILSQGAKNSLGGIATVFRVDDWGSEFEALLAGKIVLVTEKEEEADNEFNNEDFIQQAKTLVEDAIDKLTPWEMQDLFAGMLRAMGYKVHISPPGPDGGVDILAHRDAFGFENPIIKVQVKHKKSTSSAPEIQQLLGANPIGASCIFVSTGGFTSAASKTAQQNGVKVLDLSKFASLLVEWYENLPNETKALVPLQKIYIPYK